jgi:hypothetical protein
MKATAATGAGPAGQVFDILLGGGMAITLPGTVSARGEGKASIGPRSARAYNPDRYLISHSAWLGLRWVFTRVSTATARQAIP